MRLIIPILFIGTFSQIFAQENWKSNAFPDSLYSQYNWKFFTLMIPEVHEIIDWRMPDLGLLNAAVFYATNRAREKHGLHALKFSPSLRDMAFLHAQEMSKHRYVGHDNPWRPAFNSLNKRSRFFEANAQSENVTSAFLMDYVSGKYFYRVPDGKDYHYYYYDDTPIDKHTYWTFGIHVVEQFLNSPRHKRNMLFFHHHSLGCGVAVEPYQRIKSMPMGFGVQNFGK